MASTFLEKLDYTEKNGLVFCDNVSMAKNNSERLYISEIKKLKAYAVLFRRFYRDETSPDPHRSEPAVCIFRGKDIPINSEEHIALHAALWSSGKNEIYIILGDTKVEIINARKPAEYDNGKLSIENLKLASEAEKKINNDRFSAHLFRSGTFWEQTKFKNKISESDSPHIHLLNHLMATRKEFLHPKNNLNLEARTIDKLLVVSILVKFLEEIKDDDGTHTLLQIYKKHNVKNFSEAVKNNLTLEVFHELSSKFNGKIFDKFSVDEKKKIKSSNLTLLSQFLKADVDPTSKQYFLWKQYSFNYLPAEVISAIYENFIQAEAKRTNNQREKGVVYTPIHLVNFLIDEAMPLDKSKELFENEQFRILDPTCGSGVFLVAAFKRLLQWWAINNRSQDNIQYPDSDKAQKILENNIFGIDVKETAILVSILGLTTALLDKLSPKEVWNKLKLKDLSERNLQRNNFFDWAVNTKINNEKFDLVIGNPPFNPETGQKKSEVLSTDIKNRLEFKHKKIPRNNFALHFFEGAMTLTKKICLILPSNILLYDKANTATNYRRKIFKNYSISNIYDFTHLRRDLFRRSADTPVVAILAENTPSKKHPINHVVVKRMVSSEKKMKFEIDHYDYNVVSWSTAVDPDKQFIWKTNLLGGGRLYQLVYRLSLLRNLKRFLEEKTDKNSEWIYSSGYKVGKKTKKAHFLSAGNKITDIFEDGTCKISDEPEENHFLEWFPDPILYTPPVLVIDQVLGNKCIPTCLIQNYSPKNYIYFDRDFVGIHAPKQNLSDLIKIKNFIGKKFNDLYRLYALIQSGSCMIQTETEINKRDIDSLPYPQNEEYLQLSEYEEIIQKDVLKYYIHLGKAISKNSAGNKLLKEVTQSQLQKYGETLCSTLNSIYATKQKSWQLGKTFQTSSITVCQLGYGKNGKLKGGFSKAKFDSIKKFLTNQKSNKGVVYKRILRFYEHRDGFDCIFLLKPNAYRYWLESIALKDADDTFVDLRREGF